MSTQPRYPAAPPSAPPQAPPTSTSSTAPPPPPRATITPSALQLPSGIPAFGTLVQVLSSQPGILPEVFTTINNIGDISGPQVQVAEVETTSHSTGIPHRTFIPSLIDDGNLSFPAYWNPQDPTQNLLSPYGLEHLFQNRTVTRWRLVNTDPGRRTREFLGFVSQLNETAPVAGIMTRAVTIRITSAPMDVQASVTLAPTTQAAPNTGGNFSITVTSTDAIGWMPFSDVPWIIVTSPIQAIVGNGTIDYTVDPQPVGTQPARTGNIILGATTFAVTQAAQP